MIPRMLVQANQMMELPFTDISDHIYNIMLTYNKRLNQR